MEKLKLNIRLDENEGVHYQKKEHCPACTKKRFVRFYDFDKHEYLPEQYGRCDRQEQCGYYLNPYKDGTIEDATSHKINAIPVPAVKIKYVDKEILSKSLSSYHTNTFVNFLIDRVGHAKAMETVLKFYIGTAKNNGTIFWQIDQFLNIRTAQKIHYDETGHRIKSIDPQRLFKVIDDYKPCLFGEHQLYTNINNNVIYAICESEKTAILCECYINEINGNKIVWLACSGSNGLTFDKIQPLRGKKVMLVPDFSFHARATWGLLQMRKSYKDVNGKQVLSIDEHGEVVEYESAKDRLISIGAKVSFFDPYPEVNNGSDIADFLIKDKLEPDPTPSTKIDHQYDSLKSQAYHDAQIKINKPDFSKYKITVAQTDETKKELIKILNGKSSFQINTLDDGTFEIWMNNTSLAEKVSEYFDKNPVLKDLVNRFDLAGGSISVTT